MGLEIEREDFGPEDHAAFQARLEESLEALGALLSRPGFGHGPTTLGAELEVSLVDAEGLPLAKNREVLARSRDPRLTLELDRFNLECNLRPVAAARSPFRALRAEFEGAVAELRRAAAAESARVVMVGILPTLRREDLGRDGMTESRRYRALSAAIRARRQGPFRLRIHGEDELDTTSDDVTFEGAATALQLHLRVPPERFADHFNAAQMATAPALAAGGNSPLFLGLRLWEETRVALFKQAVDDRTHEARRVRESRVSFGRGWAREGALELFEEAVRLHPPLLPVVDRDEAPLARLGAGRVPSLRELRLHQGTVWSWNRPIYDPAEGGHLRIELRALPSGPSVVDMLANAALLLGLTFALSRDAAAWRSGLPFDAAHHNFYRAAQFGLEAELVWPDAPGVPARPRRARELCAELLERAAEGLLAAGVDPAESDGLLGVLARRIETGTTGARWQRRALERLERERPREEALRALMERYLAHSEAGEPVHTWPLP